MDDDIINDIFKFINNKKRYLGVYTVKEYNDLNLKDINHFSLILFISSISENLGHFATIFKGKDNKYIF